MNDKSIVEKQFDEIISNKEIIDYCYDTNKLRGKDKQIIRFFEKLDIKQNKFLEIGPGTGRFLRYLKKKSAEYIAAVDISDEALARCKEYLDESHKLDIETNRLCFDDNSFDVIISFEVFEHIFNPENYLEEMIRVVRNGGLIIMSTPNIISLISRVRMVLGLLPVAIASDKTHVSFYRKKDIFRIFTKYNLKPVFLPTSISLNIFNPKSALSIPSFKLISSLDDSLLFYIKVNK